jgi:hypothetical protein
MHYGWLVPKHKLYTYGVWWLRRASTVPLGIAELSRVRLLYNVVGACADAGWMSKLHPKAPLGEQRTRPRPSREALALDRRVRAKVETCSEVETCSLLACWTATISETTRNA